MKYMSRASAEGMFLKRTSMFMYINEKYVINNKNISKVSQLQLSY